MTKRTKPLPPPIRPQTTKRNARQWLNIIRYGESGSVTHLQADMGYRVEEIISNPKLLKQFLGPYYRKYILAYHQVDDRALLEVVQSALLQLCKERNIPLKSDHTHLSSSQLLETIAKRGFEVGLFLSHVAGDLRVKRFQPYYDLELLVRLAKNFSVIVFSEVDITDPVYDPLVEKCSLLFDHVIRYPLYNEKDCQQFIRHYSSQWKFTIPEKTQNQIIAACGGYLWLIHQAMRTLRDNPDIAVTDALENEAIMTKVRSIWKRLSEPEKHIVQKIASTTLEKEDKESHTYKYLRDIKLIRENGKTVSLTIPIFSSIVKREQQTNRMKSNGNQIFLGQRDISDTFTRAEHRIMQLLLSRKRTLVSRTDLAHAVWGSTLETKYSDWAIDRLLYRLRNKLTTLGVEKHLLKTVKRRGVIFG